MSTQCLLRVLHFKVHLHHFALNHSFAVGPVHHPLGLEVDQVFLHLNICCVGGKEAPARLLHPVVIPHITSQVNETGGGLDVLHLPKYVCPIVLSADSAPVAAAEGPSHVNARAEEGRDKPLCSGEELNL